MRSTYFMVNSEGVRRGQIGVALHMNDMVMLRFLTKEDGECRQYFFYDDIKLVDDETAKKAGFSGQTFAVHDTVVLKHNYMDGEFGYVEKVHFGDSLDNDLYTIRILSDNSGINLHRHSLVHSWDIFRDKDNNDLPNFVLAKNISLLHFNKNRGALYTLLDLLKEITKNLDTD